MKKIFSLLWGILVGYVSGTLEEIAKAMEAEDRPHAINRAVTLVAAGLGVVGFLALAVSLIYAARRAIFTVVAPVALVTVLVKSYQVNHPSISAPPQPVQQPGTIELATARAEKVYPLLTQGIFLVFTELCRYLPGLVKPFSLANVVPKVHYEITTSFVIIFHFIVGKGDSEVDRQTIQEIAQGLIDQHLQAHDFPLSLPANYTSADGKIFPSLKVDGVYDVGQHFRIDLVITNEAEVARIRGGPDGSTSSGVIIRDEDFDNDSGL